MQRRSPPASSKNKPGDTPSAPSATQLDRASKEQKEVAGKHKNDGQKPFKGAR